MNPELIDLLFRPEAPSLFPELDENDHDPIESGDITEWGGDRRFRQDRR
jgi:hypothetical protein